MTARFLEGFCPEIKDEIYAREVPAAFDQLMELAIRLENHADLRRRARGAQRVPSPPQLGPAAVSFKAAFLQLNIIVEYSITSACTVGVQDIRSLSVR